MRLVLVWSLMSLQILLSRKTNSISFRELAMWIKAITSSCTVYIFLVPWKVFLISETCDCGGTVGNVALEWLGVLCNHVMAMKTVSPDISICRYTYFKSRRIRNGREHFEQDIWDVPWSWVNWSEFLICLASASVVVLMGCSLGGGKTSLKGWNDEAALEWLTVCSKVSS